MASYTEQQMKDAAKVQPQHRTTEQQTMVDRGKAAGMTTVSNADKTARDAQSAG